MTAHHTQSKVHKDTDEFGVEELNWAAQSPELNLTDDLWDKLEWRL